MALQFKQTLPLPSPEKVRAELPLEGEIAARTTVCNIIDGIDDRLLLVVGPCSLHNEASAVEYAIRLKKLSEKLKDRFFIVMRAFVEKPRTRLGWKGMLHDPRIDGTHDAIEGIRRCRSLLLRLHKLGLPLATEFLEPFSAHYLSDLVTLGYIGARTCASPLHRCLASALPFPVGFKNPLDGEVSTAIHGALSAGSSHFFMTLDDQGRPVQAQSRGNPYAHVVLRGTDAGPNCNQTTVESALNQLTEQDLKPFLTIDCSHGNSGKDPLRQKEIFAHALDLAKHFPVRGLMLESHLEAGSQHAHPFARHDKSITDSCLSFEETETLLCL